MNYSFEDLFGKDNELTLCSMIDKRIIIFTVISLICLIYLTWRNTK